MDLRVELQRFRDELPIEAASTPPASWYTRAEVLERETETTFRDSWQYVCPSDRVAAPGSYVRVDIVGDSYLVLRDRAGVLRALSNVCRHHAAQLLEGSGCVEKLVCPYHGWTYDLDGSLRSAPNMGALKDFNRARFGLPQVPVEVWGPLVFLHPGRPARALAQELAPLAKRLADFGMDGLRHAHRRRYPIQCNWKVFCDNYLDGGYHVGHLHKGLAGQLALSEYRTELFERFNVQSCPPARDAHFRGRDFRERIGAGALYAWIHPNLMLNRYGPILDTNWVVPLGVDRCEVVFDYWFAETEGEDARRFIEASLEASDDVQQEDVAICESVQRGVSSRSYDTGRYARTETGMYQFHRLLAKELRGPE
ncbi:MAG: aromatic ring-hydroxylating dioxygenase subunit alpha [Planctomycetes bacterium]|nr:aromatic ring-hydroxylating dioxygenase subunit alpha [Planctomycetota bacterium]